MVEQVSAQQTTWVQQPGDEEMLDVQTSAALLRWMETALVPDGIDPELWARWAEDGCRGALEAHGARVTPDMLGRWARSGTLR